MKMNKKVLILGTILGLITVLLLGNYINSLKSNNEGKANSEYTDVVLAQVTIPKHTKITEEMLEVVSLPKKAIHPNAIKSATKIIDGVSITEILKGEQILEAKVVTEDMKTNLAYDIPEGMRAVTIPVDEITGVANYITQGDKLDVLVTITTDTDPTTTYTKLQNIEVLEIGNLQSRIRSSIDESEVAEETSLPNSITILVNPQQAEVVAFATLNGNFHLTLRNPMDTDKVNLDYYSYSNLATYKER